MNPKSEWSVAEDFLSLCFLHMSGAYAAAPHDTQISMAPGLCIDPLNPPSVMEVVDKPGDSKQQVDKYRGIPADKVVPEFVPMSYSMWCTRDTRSKTTAMATGFSSTNKL